MEYSTLSRAQADVWTLRKDISLRIAKVLDNWAETQRRLREGLPARSYYFLFLADIQALWQEVKYIVKSAAKNQTHKAYYENVDMWVKALAQGYIPEINEANHIVDALFYTLKFAGILDLTYSQTAPMDVWRESV